MSQHINAERLSDRANDLTVHNGLAHVFVTLDPATPAMFAWLDVEFYNDIDVADILNDVGSNVKSPSDIFGISGGTRLQGNLQSLQGVTVVDVQAGSTAQSLRLQVSPVGDYSQYQLQIVDDTIAFDPLFKGLYFKFRPGCFNTNCAPLSAYPAASEEPLIDYLAKDFHSFKHVLINALRERVPNWQPTSEADLDQVLIDLIAADADELSDFQDRVMNEASVGRARKRVSLARYARLMDYHIGQGNQASTWLAMHVTTSTAINQAFGVWTGDTWQAPNAVVFKSDHSATAIQTVFPELNTLLPYTWGGVVTALEPGATQTDLIDISGSMTQVEAEALRDRFRLPDVTHVLIQQNLNPNTGRINGVDKTARQIVALLEGDEAAEVLEDPVLGTWFVRIKWQASDAARRRYCYSTECEGLPLIENVTHFCGNLIRVAHGRPYQTVFSAPGTPLGYDDTSRFEQLEYRHYAITQNKQLLRSLGSDQEQLPIRIALPHAHLSFRRAFNVLDAGDGEQAPKSTLQVEVDGFAQTWQEQSDLISSQADDTHYIVETDENGLSQIVFGNNLNGRALPEDAVVTCRYQIGLGTKGNVGADTLTHFDDSVSGFPFVTRVWNPLDVSDGAEKESRDSIIRKAPERYRARQLRAVTLEDYAHRAEELPAVSHAHARYLWAGSWRTVRVAIDLKAGYSWSEQRQTIQSYLDAVRLIGEDLEVREARKVPIDIHLSLCVHSDYWPEAISFELAQAFSNTYTANGKPGFFHPDAWTFGQTLYASQVIHHALTVPGVDRVLKCHMRRWLPRSGTSTGTKFVSPDALQDSHTPSISVLPYELIEVASDPNHLERGRIQFDLLGGRR